MTTTMDLSEFGSRELRMAGELLTAYGETPPDFLGDGVQVMMNRDSGYVFLTDEDFAVAIMNGDRQAEWLFCPECAAQDFAEDLPNHDCCQSYLRDMRM